MKKLMIALAAVAMAIGANAAAVVWTTGLNTDGFAGPDGNKLTTADGYTYIITFFDASGVQVGTASSTTTVKPNGSVGGTYSGYNFQNSVAGDPDDTIYTYMAQVVIKDGDKIVRETEKVAFDMPYANNASINFSTGGGFKTTGSKWGAWQTVPEPTSGLLLLIGVAGLALKRKRA